MGAEGSRSSAEVAAATRKVVDADVAEELELFALAGSAEERTALVGVSASGTHAPGAAAAVTPGQVFLQGLAAVQAAVQCGAGRERDGWMKAAQGALMRLQDAVRTGNLVPGPSGGRGVHAYAAELEARVALVAWGPQLDAPHTEGALGVWPPSVPDAQSQGPATTLAFLKDKLRLVFDDEPPAAAREGVVAGGGRVTGSGARGAAALPTSLSQADYGLDKFVAELRGHQRPNSYFKPAAAPELLRLKAGELDREARLALAFSPPYLSQLGQGERGVAWALREVAAMVEGDENEGAQPWVVEGLGEHLTAEQLEALAGLVPTLRGVHAWQASNVRKLYGWEWGPGGPWEDAFLAPPVARAALLSSMSALVERTAAEGAPAESLVWLRLRLEAARVALALKAPDAAAAAGWPLSPTLVAGLLRVAACATAPAPTGYGGDGSDVHPSGVFRATFVTHAPVRSLEAVDHVDLGPLLPALGGNAVRELIGEAVARLLADPAHGDPHEMFEPRGWGSELAGVMDARWEARLVTEASLTRSPPLARASAQGEAWARMYTAAGGDYRELAERVELGVAADSPERVWGPVTGVAAATAPPPELRVVTKGVKQLLVKVYELHPWNYFTATGQDLSLALELEGLGAWQTVTLDLSRHTSLERVRTTVPLPWLQGRRGVWIVELIGGGRNARALLRRGAMRCVWRCGAAGQALSLAYEDGERVQGGRVWLGGKEYAADEKSGEVVVPYRPDSLGDDYCASLVIGDATGFAALVRQGMFVHRTEAFAFSCRLHFDPESASLPRGGQPPLLLAPALALHGWPVGLDLLEDVTLTLTTRDADGVEAKAPVPGLDLANTPPGRVLSVPVRLPERCVSLSALLTARVRKLSPGADGEPQFQDVSASESWELAGTDAGLRTLVPHLTREPAREGGGGGCYMVEVVGRVGEPAPASTQVRVVLRHALAITGQAVEVSKTCGTDASGRVGLGPLAGIASLSITVAAGPPQQHALEPSGRVTWDLGALPGRVGGPLHVPPKLHVMAGGQSGVRVAVPYPAPLGAGAAARDATVEGEGIVLMALGGLHSAGPVRDVTDGHVHLELGAPTITGSTAGAVGGYVVVSGDLPPGRYNLTMLAIGEVVEIVVLEPLPAPAAATATAAPAAAAPVAPPGMLLRGGMRLLQGACMVAEEGEAAPLTLLDVRASGCGGVGIVLGGSRAELAAASVSLVLTRFLPLNGTGGQQLHQLGQGRVWGVLAHARDPIEWIEGKSAGALADSLTNQYESNRRMSDDVRYVLERQLAEKEGGARPGCLLPRPSLLAAAWQRGATNTRTQTARGGEGFMGPSGRAMMKCMAAPCAAAPMYGDMARARIGGGGGGYRNMGDAVEELRSVGLGFCPNGLVLTGLQVDVASGVVEVPPDQLAAAVAVARKALAPEQGGHSPTVPLDLLAAGLRLATVFASSSRSGAAAAATVTLAMTPSQAPLLRPPPVVTSALARPFAPNSACVEARSCAVVGAGLALQVGDAGSARLQAYGSLAAVWKLMSALAHAEGGAPPNALAPFALLGNWGGLGRGAKLRALGAAPCRELALFTALKDRPFFNGVVAPLLRSKLESELGFLDAWLLAAAGGPHTEGATSSHTPPTPTWADIARQWTRPDRHAQLNALEVVLLELAVAAAAPGDPGAAWAAAGAALRVRAAAWRAAVRARGRPEREKERRRFEIALSAGGMDSLEEGAAEMREAAKKKAAAPPRPPPPPPTFGASPMGGGPGGPAASILFGGAPPPMPQAAARRSLMAEASQVEEQALVLHDFEVVEDDPYGMEGGEEEKEEEDDGDSSGGSSSSDEDGSGSDATGADREKDKEMDDEGDNLQADRAARRRAAAAPPVFRPHQATKQWGEVGYWQASAATHPHTLIPPTLLWADYAEHCAGLADRLAAAGPAPGGAHLEGLLARGELGTLLSGSLAAGGCSATDAVACLAVTGLPWADVVPGGVSLEQGETPGSVALRAPTNSPAIVYMRTTQPAALSHDASDTCSAGAVGASSAPPVLLLQKVVDPADVGPLGRGVEEDEEGECEEGPREVAGPLVAGRVYAYQVTVTSARGVAQSLDLTVVAPHGAVALSNRPGVWTSQVHLDPFGTQRLLMHFYMPFPKAAPGYGQCLSSAARKGRLLAVGGAVGSSGSASTGHDTGLVVVAEVPVAAPPEGTELGWRELCAQPRSAVHDAALLRFITTSKELGSDTDWGLVRWRLRADRAFYVAVTDALRARRMWPYAVWSYAAYHAHGPTLSELLTLPQLATVSHALGPHVQLPPLWPTPLKGVSEGPGGGGLHAEFWPLITPRAHPLGGERPQLNEQAARAWKDVVDELARCPGGPEALGLLRAAYHRMLQERLEESSALVARATAAAATALHLPAMVLDYLRLWLLLATRPDQASPTSTITVPTHNTVYYSGPHLDALRAGSGVASAWARNGDIADPRWRERWAAMARCFQDVLAVAGGAPAPLPSGAVAGGSDTGFDAATEPPSLVLQDGGGTLVVHATGMAMVGVAAYEMEPELLFSAQPFAAATATPSSGGPSGAVASGSGGGNFAYVRPAYSAPAVPLADLPLAPGSVVGTGAGARRLLDPAALLPGLPRNTSVMVEVTGSGLVSRHPLLRCALHVSAFEPLGLVQVVAKEGGAPVVAAYVKVFARGPGREGDTRGSFHKDGYTDLLGRFDVWALTGGPSKVGRLAVLVTHPELGSCVLHMSPPPH